MSIGHIVFYNIMYYVKVIHCQITFVINTYIKIIKNKNGGCIKNEKITLTAIIITVMVSIVSG